MMMMGSFLGTNLESTCHRSAEEFLHKTHSASTNTNTTLKGGHRFIFYSLLPFATHRGTHTWQFLPQSASSLDPRTFITLSKAINRTTLSNINQKYIAMNRPSPVAFITIERLMFPNHRFMVRFNPLWAVPSGIFDGLCTRNTLIYSASFSTQTITCQSSSPNISFRS